MKKLLLSLAPVAAVLLSGCGPSDQTLALIQTIQNQNETIAKQQQMLLDQQQTLADQDSRITILMEQMSSDEEMLKQIHQELLARAKSTEESPRLANVDVPKNQIVKSLAGFNGRLSASIGYAAYADALSDLNSTTAATLLQVKDQNFVDSVNRILRIYNLGGDFWEKFMKENSDEIILTQTDRYRYAGVGVTFIEGYHARPPDVRKFWRTATTQLQSLMETNQQDLGIASTAFQR